MPGAGSGTMTKMMRATLLAAAALLAACGQKGALFLPDSEREVITSVPTAPASTPATTPAPAGEEDDDAPAGPAGANGATQ